MTDAKKERSSKKLKESLKTLSTNYWAIATVVLAILLIVTLLTGGVTGAVIGADEAGQKVTEWASGQVDQVELVSVEEVNGFYAVTFSYLNPETQQRDQGTLQLTKDGENLVFQSVPLETPTTPPTPSAPTQPAPSTYSEEDLIKLKIFSDCLGEKGFKIYGANWCGWTKKLVVDTLGGFDIASAAYIECTEQEELCSREGVTGYPTIKLNGEAYNGERTIDALAQATRCPAPELTRTATTDSTTAATCG